MSYLWLRGSTWFFRKAVPHRLRSVLGKKEWRVSLKTGSYDEAKKKAVADPRRLLPGSGLRESRRPQQDGDEASLRLVTMVS